MFVLRRGAQEAIVITLPDGRNVRLLVLDVDRGRVRLGFAADRDIVIDRAEIHRIKQVAL